MAPWPANDRSRIKAEAHFLSGELSLEECCPSPPLKGRRAVRIPVSLGAGLRQRGASGISVEVTDLSTDGFRVGSHLELAEGTDVWLRLPGLEPCHARVMWHADNHIGCAFIRPLHPAVLDMLVTRLRR